MSRALLALVVSSILGVHPAMACGLGSCRLPDDWHLENERFNTIPGDEWSWMNHDLALARLALENGDFARAESIGTWLNHAIELRREQMEDVRGKRRVNAMRRAASQLASNAGKEDSRNVPSGPTQSGETDEVADQMERREEAADRARRESERQERTMPVPRERPEPRGF